MGDLANLAFRFPHLGEAIFDQVDDKTLINCRKMSKIWCQIIDGQRNTWLRLLKKYIGKFDDLADVVEKLYALDRSRKTPYQKRKELFIISKEAVYLAIWERAVKKMPFEMLKVSIFQKQIFVCHEQIYVLISALMVIKWVK